MLAALDAITRQAAPDGLGTVVYVGAGEGVDLGAVLAKRPRRLILVDGDVEQASALRRRFARNSAIDVKVAVFSAEAGPRDWHRQNLGRLNGLLVPAERLLRVYPRLRELERSPVESVALGPWLEHLDMPEENNLLVLDIAGTEGALLESLPERQFDVFPWVLIRGASDVLHEGGSTLAQSRARIVQLGYEVKATDSREALWPVELYHANTHARKLARLEEQLKARLETEAAAKAKGCMEQMSHELAQAQALASNAVKLRTLREADLKDLQARYEVLQTQQAAALQLLSELARRLGSP